MATLVLGRRIEETLVLYTQAGERISITVKDIRRGTDKVRIAVDLPDSVLLLRGEVESQYEIT